MTSSRMRVKRREGAKPTLKPVSLLLPVFPTHTRFPRNGEDVMSYHLGFHLWLFSQQEFMLFGQTHTAKTLKCCLPGLNLNDSFVLLFM